MSFEAWLMFCTTEAVLCFTPGPAVLLVVSLSLAQGGASGLRSCIGILAANTLYFALSATGLAAVLLASWELFVLIKWAGAAYLVWLGLRMLVARTRGSARAPAGGSEGRGPFLRGFVVQGANPKALVFFTALLPQFINPHAPVAPQILILGLSSVLIELIALCSYAALSHRARGLARGPRFAGAFERLGGALLIAAGARLAAGEHSE